MSRGSMVSRPRAHRKTLGIEVPVPICNAERTKQLFPRIILGELAGQPGNDRGGEIRIGIGVVENLSWRVRHGAVENELGPIGAKRHIEKCLLLAVLNSLIPIKSGVHIQKALSRDGFLSVIDVRNTAIGKEIQNRMIETVKYSVLVEHADQRADYGLCRRVYLMWNICGVGCVIGLGDNSPVTDNKQTVKALAFPIGDKPSERG